MLRRSLAAPLIYLLIPIGLIVSAMPVWEVYFLSTSAALCLLFGLVSMGNQPRFIGVRYYELAITLFIVISILNAGIFRLWLSIAAGLTFLFGCMIFVWFDRFKPVGNEAVILNKCVFYLSLFIALDCFYQFFSGVDLFFGYQPMNGYKITGPFKNTYTDTLSIIFIYYFLALYRKDKSISGLSRSACAIALFANIAVVVMSGSRSSILVLLFTPFISILVVYGFWRGLSKATIFLAIAGAGVFLVYQFVIDMPFFSVFLNKIWVLWELLITGFSFSDYNSTTLRLVIWTDLINVFIEYPILFVFGAGFSTLSFANSELFAKPYLFTVDAQSVWLDLIYSSGVVGTFMFVIFLILFYRKIGSYFSDNPDKLYACCLIFWFVSPFSVQHKLESAWYFMQIVFSLILVLNLRNMKITNEIST